MKTGPAIIIAVIVVVVAIFAYTQRCRSDVLRKFLCRGALRPRTPEEITDYQIGESQPSKDLEKVAAQEEIHRKILSEVNVPAAVRRARRYY